MKEAIFNDGHGRKLIVRVNRSNIQIHTEDKQRVMVAELVDDFFDIEVDN